MGHFQRKFLGVFHNLCLPNLDQGYLDPRLLWRKNTNLDLALSQGQRFQRRLAVGSPAHQPQVDQRHLLRGD